jgi:cytochrome c-type biogenesis protein CcmH
MFEASDLSCEDLFRLSGLVRRKDTPEFYIKEQAESMKPSKSFRICLCLTLVLLWGVFSFAAENKSSEDLIREIEDNLIAPCCWSQPVSQHYSEAADQIRKEVRTMVAEGKSRDEILDYYVAKYGERILAAPRPKGFNSLAYILPWTALILGACLLIPLIKKLRTQAPAPSPDKAPDPRYSSIVEKELKEFEE